MPPPVLMTSARPSLALPRRERQSGERSRISLAYYRNVMGVESNEAEEAVASLLF